MRYSDMMKRGAQAVAPLRESSLLSSLWSDDTREQITRRIPTQELRRHINPSNLRRTLDQRRHMLLEKLPMHRDSKRDKGGGIVTAILTAAAATAIGAGIMYLLDPSGGRRRRTAVRDQVAHAWRTTESSVRRTARHAASRAKGLTAETRSRFTEADTNDQLIARIRSEMGRSVSHPRSIRVDARDGIVTLSGHVLQQELDDLLWTVSAVPGVRDVDNRLEVHEEAGSIPGLQGGGAQDEMEMEGPEERPSYGDQQESWPPQARLAAGLAGGSLLAYGLVRRDLLGLGLGVLGGALAASSAANISPQRLGGMRRARGRAGRGGVELQKSIEIDAPIDEVFEYFARYENFPTFMRHVREVRETGGDRSHWVVTGPAGIDVEWDADITQFDPNRALAWESVEGSMIRNSGIITLAENESGGTSVNVRLCYNPPGGSLGHLAATFFSADPQTEMDEDLDRLKDMIESGNPSSAAGQSARPRSGFAGGLEHTTEGHPPHGGAM